MTNKDLELIYLTVIDLLTCALYMIGHYICLALSYLCYGLDDFIGWAYTNGLIAGTFLMIWIDKYLNDLTDEKGGIVRWRKNPKLLTLKSQERWQ